MYVITIKSNRSYVEFDLFKKMVGFLTNKIFLSIPIYLIYYTQCTLKKTAAALGQ